MNPTLKEMLKRNKPVFVIGLFTFVLFVAIIVLSQRRSVKTPKLVEVPSAPADVVTAPKSEDTKQSTATADEILKGEVSQPEKIKVTDEKYGVLQIDYTDTGFSPKNTKAYQGQLAKWTNKTAKDITFVQLMPTYDELKEPFVIKAGQTFEFRLYKTKLWTYKEKETGNYGTIFVVMEVTP